MSCTVLLSLTVVVIVQKLWSIGLDTLRRFFQWFRRRLDETRRHHPGSGQHDGIFDGCLPYEILSVFPEPLDHAHFRAMHVPIFANPRVIDEIPGVHDEDVAVPLPNGIAIVRWVRVGAMSTPVG